MANHETRDWMSRTLFPHVHMHMPIHMHMHMLIHVHITCPAMGTSCVTPKYSSNNCQQTCQAVSKRSTNISGFGAHLKTVNILKIQYMHYNMITPVLRGWGCPPPPPCTVHFQRQLTTFYYHLDVPPPLVHLFVIFNDFHRLWTKMRQLFAPAGVPRLKIT